MTYIRRVASTDAVEAGFPHYRVVVVAGGESATVLGCFLGDGGHPPLHVHDMDLFYVVLSGSAAVRLAHRRHEAKAGEVIYIPAGLPHGSDNESGAPEHHLEILVPGVQPGAPLLRPVKSVDDVPLPAASPSVKSVSAPPDETSGNARRWAMTDESAGGRSARVTAVELDGPQDPGPSADRKGERLVVVTEGRLTVEIAARRQVVPAEAVIVIPADVPHRLWNASSSPVRYLDVDVTAPTAFERLAVTT
jgi:quercetin dioxygenase-like cupin family protein